MDDCIMKSNIDEQYLVDNRREIGEMIKSAREKKQLSQQELADNMGISRSTVSKIEDGKWNYGIDTLVSFGVYLDFEITIQDK